MLGLPSKSNFRCASAVALCALLLAMTPVQAEEDELPDTILFGTVLRSIGLAPSTGPGIEYRERSPLVIPPKRELPPPEASNVDKNPNWPVKPDIKRSRELKAATRRSGAQMVDKDMEASRPLRPNELNVGSRTSSSRDGRAMDPERSAQQLRPSELGDTGLFSRVFGGGVNREESAGFIGEAPRATLTEPPAGYQTPSPNQPYGVGKEKIQNKPLNAYIDGPVGQ